MRKSLKFNIYLTKSKMLRDSSYMYSQIETYTASSSKETFWINSLTPGQRRAALTEVLAKAILKKLSVE